MTRVDDIAEKLRHEPYHVLPMRYNCIGKSLQFKKECRRDGIRARVVICFGIITTRRLKMPMIHGWGEVDGKRIEVARPLDQRSPWGTFDIDLKPIMAVGG